MIARCHTTGGDTKNYSFKIKIEVRSSQTGGVARGSFSPKNIGKKTELTGSGVGVQHLSPFDEKGSEQYRTR